MKKRIGRKTDRVLPLLMAMVVALSFTGCGSVPNPVDGEDVVESTETEIRDDAVAGSDKPAESTAIPSVSPEVSPTAKPTAEPAASPEPTATPEPTRSPQPTPEPTAPPHTHSFKVESSTDATCATEGKVVKVCECRERQTEVVPATGQHNWVEEMQVVTIPSTGHVEQVQVQVGTGETRHEYACSNCGERFDTPSGVVDHCFATGDINHAFASTIIYDIPGDPIYEVQSTWVVDTPESTSTVGTGRYTCSVCGATK
ncbi:MAG: hypothetical protein NC307_12120 [Roseburia sp.]|nr:hypothetical protein [Roseburia sp.]